jgi:hypothetical protein
MIRVNSRGGYEPPTVPITLGRGAFPLHTYIYVLVVDDKSENNNEL